MRKWKKQAKQAFLAAAAMTALFCSTLAYASTVVTDQNPSAILYNQASINQMIEAGDVLLTYTGASQTGQSSTTYIGNIIIQSDGIWRPMDAANTIYLNGTLELNSGAILDLSYKYGENYPDNPWGNGYNRTFRTSSSLLNPVVFHDGAILRLNLGGRVNSALNDKVYLYNPRVAADETTATVNVQIRACKYFSGLDWASNTGNTYSGSTGSPIILLYNITDEVNNNLNFVAQTYYTDATLNKYLFVPKLTSSVSGTSKTYNLDWTATRTDLISQGVFSAANAQLSMRNLWRMENGLFWKRGEELRAANRLGRSEGADGAWTQIWRGDYSYNGAFGSSFGQSYKGIQVGYDKQREGDYYGGKLYTGLFLSMLNSNADFHQHTLKSGSDEALYSGSAGDLKSGGIGLYTSWIGDKGHYLDFTVRGSKLSNDYKFCDSDDNLHENNYNTWVYSAGIRYGCQQQLSNGWYLEPQVGLSYGRMKGYSYMQDNNMRYTQDQMDMFIGRLGVTAGRNFTSGDKCGTVYVKTAINHDFKESGKARADAMYWGSYYNKHGIRVEDYLVGSSLPVDTLAGKDTWYEFALGANLQTGKDKNTFVELTKTAGGKVNTDWQVNAGMSWRFNGPSADGKKTVQKAVCDRNPKALETSPKVQPQAVTGGQDSTTGKEASAVQPAQSGKAAPDSQTIQSRQVIAETVAAGETDTPDAGGNSLTTWTATATDQADTQLQQASKLEQINQTDRTTQLQPTTQNGTVERTITAGSVVVSNVSASETTPAVAYGNEPGFFNLAPLVVEAARPDWEKKLSPGTVSVIHVPEYKGEMKNLPDLLQTVPGVYVQRLQGTGHYTVAKVRGSTGGQVNIYVDGVLVNSAGEAAVDLSAIPIENVDHIEVYRGYVPARFAGSPLGGAINIVTKKPINTKGSISTGIRSFGGYTGNLELTAPAGKGSVLFALNRDQAEGDFEYDQHINGYSDANGNPLVVAKHRKNNDYYNTDALLKYQDDNWFAKLTWQHNKTGFPDTTYLWDADQYEYPYRHQETVKTGLTLGRRQTAGNLEWGWKLDASYQDKEATSMQTKSTTSGNNTLAADNEFRSRCYEGSVDGSWKLAKNHLVEFMFNASRETMKVDTNNFTMWPDYQHSVTSVIDYYKQYFKKDYQTNNYYFQVQDTMTLNRSGNLFFTPVLRTQKMTMDVDLGDPDIGSWKYSYGLGLKKVQNEHWTFRGSYGTYYKYPNWYELFGDGVNVKSRWEAYKNRYSDFQLDSSVERGTNWDVSANWQGKAFNADSDVTLTYFNRHAENLSTYSLDYYGVGYYSNLAAGKIQGLELESKFKWQSWDLLLAATWNDSLITNSGSKASLVMPAEWQVGHPFPWVPEWEYNVRLGYRFPGDKLTVFGEYHYLGEVGVYYDNARRLQESLELTNLGLKYAFNNKIKLTAGINDLFNKGPKQLCYYQNSVGTSISNVQYPLQGRTYYATVQYFF